MATYPSLSHSQTDSEGLCFWDAGGSRIVNYPKLHSLNCTTKHQATHTWFKPTVRVFKNMRNAMIDAGYIAEGLAPSYFIEGMLYNVPDASFGGSYGATVVAALTWLQGAERPRLVCANRQYFLINPNSPVTWRDERYAAFISAATKFWNEW